jgi:hypothetical protein
LKQPAPIGDSKVAFTVKVSQDDFLHVEMLSRAKYVVVELFANAE